MKKPKKNSFTKALRENQKKILVKLPGSDEEIRLSEATHNTIADISASPIDAMQPITANEIVENAETDLTYLAIRTAYADGVFSMYEAAIKSPEGRKQTFVVPLALDVAYDLWEGGSRIWQIIDVFVRNTNIGLIMDEFPKKIMKKLETWAEDDNSARAFVIRIPNILMFNENVVKKKTSTPITFDLIFVVTNAKEKSLYKAKKRSKDQFEEFGKIFVKDLVSVLDNFGASSVHIPLWEEFYTDPYAAARLWAACLAENKYNLLKRVVFSTKDPQYLICFNQEAIRLINSDEGNGMRVV